MSKITNVKNNLILLLFSLSMAYASAAGGGLTKTKSFLENFSTALHGLALVTVVIATIIVGYKVLFNGDSIRDCKNIIIGAALIGGASEIAAMLAGQ